MKSVPSWRGGYGRSQDKETWYMDQGDLILPRALGLIFIFLGSVCIAIVGKGICDSGNLLKVCGKTQFLLFILHCSIKQHRSGSSEPSFWEAKGPSYHCPHLESHGGAH